MKVLIIRLCVPLPLNVQVLNLTLAGIQIITHDETRGVFVGTIPATKPITLSRVGSFLTKSINFLDYGLTLRAKRTVVPPRPLNTEFCMLTADAELSFAIGLGAKGFAHANMMELAETSKTPKTMLSETEVKVALSVNHFESLGYRTAQFYDSPTSMFVKKIIRYDEDGEDEEVLTTTRTSNSFVFTASNTFSIEPTTKLIEEADFDSRDLETIASEFYEKQTLCRHTPDTKMNVAPLEDEIIGNPEPCTQVGYNVLPARMEGTVLYVPLPFDDQPPLLNTDG